MPPRSSPQPYTNPVGGNPEAVRDNLREAVRLLKEAGYEVRDRKLVDVKSGAQFTIELLTQQPDFERVMLFYKPSLERLRHSQSACERSIRYSTKTAFAAGISI